MKTFRKADEWVGLAACWGSPQHTMENPTADDVAAAAAICAECLVRPECITYALREKFSAVIVAGIHLPDPADKQLLEKQHELLRTMLPHEKETRGEF